MAVCLPLIGSQKSSSRLIGHKSQLVKHIRQGNDCLVSLSGGKTSGKIYLEVHQRITKINDNLRLFDMDFYDVFV